MLVVQDASKDHIQVENDITDGLWSVDVDLGERRSRDVRTAGLRARWHARFGVAAAGALGCAGLGKECGGSALHSESVRDSEEAASERDFEHCRCSDRFCDYYILGL